MSTIAQVDSFTSTASAVSSYSKSCAIGAEASDRVIAVVVIGQNSASGATYTCIIGGAPATQKLYRANNRVAVGIFYLAVPSGTTATVEVASSNSFDNCHFSVHRLTGIDASNGLTGSQVGTNTAASIAVTINPSIAGIALAGVRAARASHRASVASGIVSAGSQTITAAISGTDSAVAWTGLTEDTEAIVAAAGSSVQAMALAVWHDAAVPAPITATANATFAPMTSSAVAGLAIAGGGASAFAPMTGSASGRVKIAAQANITFAPMTGAGAGALPIDASAASTFAPMTGTASASLAITGRANITFAPMTGTASATTGAALPVSGTGAATFAPMTGSAAGRVKIAAQASITFAAMTGSARGRVGISAPVQFLTLSVDPLDLTLTVDPLDLELTVDPIDLTIVVTETGENSVKTLPKKSPEAVFRVTLNLPGWITPDNPVIALEMLPIAGDVLLYDPAVLAPDRAQFWISDGTLGQLCTFKAMAILADGQRYTQTIRVRVAD